jgi:hypothetical protein
MTRIFRTDSQPGLLTKVTVVVARPAVRSARRRPKSAAVPAIEGFDAVVGRRGATLRAVAIAAIVCVERRDRCPTSPGAVLLACRANKVATAWPW